MSTTILRSTAAAAVVGLGSLPLFAATAGAQTCYPPTTTCVSTTSSTPTTGPSITLSATTVARGQAVGASVAGFAAGSSGIITIASVEQQIGSFTMPASGAASTSVTIPATISLGSHTVFARGTGTSGGVASASVAVTVVAAGTVISGNGSTTGTSSSSLARTGMVVVPTALVGVGLVFGGLALKRSGRRRQTNATS